MAIVILIAVPVAVILMTIVGGTTGAAIKDSVDSMGTTGAAIEDSVDSMGTTGAAIEDSVDSMGTHSKMISASSLNNTKIQHGCLRQ
jgi:ABC-type transport system involved in cytochrome bd biosynthesis fused ATPase/permease subunit